MKLLIHFMMLCSTVAYGQLVNIESQRIQTDSVRTAGNVGVHFNYQKTNGIPSAHFKATGALQLKSKSLRNIYLILGSYDYARAFKLTSNHAGFGHLRYNYKINNWLRYEVYSQIQFNELLSLRYRILGGTGLRFKINKNEKFKMYIGVSAFYEYEEVNTAEFIDQNIRLSNYGVISWKFPKDRGEFTSISYYQPSTKDFSDFRFTSQNSLVLQFGAHLAFTTHFNYFNDTRPPEGIDREVISIENGLRWSW
jgi:hypothetical protein